MSDLTPEERKAAFIKEYEKARAERIRAIREEAWQQGADVAVAYFHAKENSPSLRIRMPLNPYRLPPSTDTQE